ncbi:MAG: lysoplasmalogenase [Nannocystaceae bacterium]
MSERPEAPKPPLYLAAIALAIAGFLVGKELDLGWLRLVTKPLPVLIMAAAILGRRPDRYSRRIALGLVASAGGDVCLEISGPLFIPGVFAFLVAHLFYIAAFLRRSAAPSLLRALPYALWGWLAFSALRPGLGELEIPVAVYCVALCTMGWRSSALLGRGHGRDVWIAAVGALLFQISDTILAFNLFHAPIAGATAMIMTTYWLGQLGIAASAMSPERTRV